MIITRTPFRISFFGGGTDYPVWYKENKGAVLSTTINKYCYISCRYLPPFFNYKYLIRYRLREEVRNAKDINHPAVREALKYLRIKNGVEIVHTSDIPAQSGVGSSSSFTVGLLHTLYALKGKIVTKRKLADDAIHIEQNIINENVGSQDQVAVAFGGFNKIEFGGDNEFYVHPITLSKERVDLLQDHLMLFFTGFSRTASEIASEQIRQTNNKKKELTNLLEMVDAAVNILNGNSDLNKFGKLLHESWEIKRDLTHLITTHKINEIYDTALRSGALGGKVLGAGGGGFILLFVPPQYHGRVREKLKRLLHVPFGFEKLGSQVVLYAAQDFY
ncbi:MAG: kinase [Candidatus Omnitrophota bacterium]